MAMGCAHDGKRMHAGTPHGRFDERGDVPAARPGGGPLHGGHGRAMRMAKAVAFGACALLASRAVFAGTIWRKSGGGDVMGTSSFTMGEQWQDGKPPSKGNVYMWTSGTFRTPAANSGTYTFAGDQIRFGANATIAHKTYGTGVVIFPDAVFGWKDSDSGIAVNLAAERTTGRLGGVFTIQTPEATPLLFAVNHGTSNAFWVDARFQGEAGTAVAFSHMDGNGLSLSADVSGSLRLLGDNSAYKGVWNVYNHANAAGRAGVVIVFGHPLSAGGDPGAPRPDAVRLSGDGALALMPEACAEGPFAPPNRGVTLVDAGRFTTLGDEAWTLGMPVTGPGTLRKTGRGTVVLCGPYTAVGAITVEEGTLALSDGFSAPDGLPPLTVQAGATFALAARTGAGWTASGLALPDRVAFLASVAADGTVGAVTVDASCTLGEGPYPVRLSGQTAALTTGRAGPFAYIPVSVRRVAASDFLLCDAADGTLPRCDLSVREEDGLQIVSVAARPVVRLADTVGSPNPATTGGQWFLANSETWADGAAPSPDKDYLVETRVSNTLRTSSKGPAYAFGGGSLTLAAGQTLAHKNARLTVSNFILHANAKINAAGGGAADQVIDGTMVVVAATNAAVSFMGVENQRLWIASDICGSGAMTFCPYWWNGIPDVNVTTHTLAGDNARYVGKITVKSDFSEREEVGARAAVLQFTRPEALGGEPPAFEYEWIRLDRKCWLRPLASMTFESRNRGLRNAGWTAGILVDADITFNLKTMISYTGALWKEGAGTLGLGGAYYIGTPTWDARNDHVGERGILRIEEGWVKPLATTAFTELKLVFGAQGGIALDVESEDPGVARHGLFNAYVAHGADTEGSFILMGEALAVRLDGFDAARPHVRVPICTVPAETAAKLAGKIAVRRPLKNIDVKVVADEVAVDGIAYTRFSAVCAPSGLVLLLR